MSLALAAQCKPTRKTALLSAAIAFTFLPTIATATDDLFALSLEELMQVKVSGATLTEENQRMVPSAVTVFSREQIQRLGAQYVEELMDLVPGFQRYRGANNSLNSMYSSRGRRIGTVSSEVLMVIDGVQWAMTRSGAAAPLGPTPLYNVERVEFIRGPGSALYGSNAMMGIVNIITSQHDKSVEVATGEFERRFASAQWRHSIEDAQLAAQFRIERDQGQHFTVPDSFSPRLIATSDPRALTDVFLQAQWRDLKIDWRYSSRESDNFYSLELISDEATAEFRTQMSQWRAYWDFTYATIISHLTVYYGDDYQMSLGQLGAPGSFAAISSPSSNDAPVARVAFDARTAGLKWHNEWPLSQGAFSYGLESRQVKNQDTYAASNFDLGDLAQHQFPIRYYGEIVPNTLVENGVEQNSHGVYTQYKHAFNTNNEMILGARWDRYSDIGHHLSPRLAFVHALTANQSLKLLYGEAYRAPSISEQELINNPVQLGNRDLNPEIVRSSEMIWQGQWKTTACSLGYFSNRFDDSIILQPLGQLLVYANGEQSPTKGWEFEFSQQWTDHWITRYSHFELRDKPENAYREADRMQSFTVEYQHDKWLGSLTAIRHGNREMATQGSEATRITLPHYTLFNLNLRYAFSDNFFVSLRLKNASNEHYSSPFQTATRISGVPERGDEWLLLGSWRY